MEIQPIQIMVKNLMLKLDSLIFTNSKLISIQIIFF